jgi:hypothetical protein
MTITSTPEVVRILADELHPLDGVNPDSLFYELLDGILEDDVRPDLWGDALVGVMDAPDTEPSRWLVYDYSVYIGSARTEERARALWEHAQAGHLDDFKGCVCS